MREILTSLFNRFRAREAAATPPHESQQQRRQYGRRNQLGKTDPENLSDQQVFEMLATLRIIGQQQQRTAGRQYEQSADQRFLILRPATISPRQQASAKKRSDRRGDLDAKPVLVDAEKTGRNYPERGNLRYCQVDEDNAARQHLLAERNMRREHDQTGQTGWTEDTDVQSVPVQLHIHFAAPSSLSMVESNMLNRSLDAASPPTVYGRLTIGTPVRSDSHALAFES